MTRESVIHPSCDAVALSANSKLHWHIWFCNIISQKNFWGLRAYELLDELGEPCMPTGIPIGRTYFAECQLQQLSTPGAILSTAKFSDLKVRPLRHRWLICGTLCLYLTVSVFCAFSKLKANTAGQLLLVSQSLSKIFILFLHWKSSTGFRKVVPTVVLRQLCQYHNLRNSELCIFVSVSLSEVLSMCSFFSIHFCRPSHTHTQKKTDTKWSSVALSL